MTKLIVQLEPGQASSPVTSHPVALATHNFAAFDSTSDLWKDYWAQFSNMYGSKFNTNRASA